MVPVQLHNNEPTIQVDKIKEPDCNDAMSVQVLGEMPKVIKFEGETTIQVILLFVLFLFYIIYNTERN